MVMLKRDAVSGSSKIQVLDSGYRLPAPDVGGSGREEQPEMRE